MVIIMDAKNRKATFVLPSWIIEEMAECVKLGRAHSISAIVREALEHKLRAIREEMLAAEFEEASKDPDFISDINNTMTGFEHVDSETARMIKQ